MPIITPSHSFCADYSSMSACLFAIQAQQASGAFNAYPELIQLLNTLELDLVNDLFNRTLVVYGIINGNITVTVNEIKGDFSHIDFSRIDYKVGYLDTTNTSYSSQFKTVTNIFFDFCSRQGEISEENKLYIEYALLPVLDALEELKAYLVSLKFNVCVEPENATCSNSPDLYLQTAGSDGMDGTLAGIHLRWGLTGVLVDHFPKGTAPALNTVGFNQANDFVFITRTPYINPVSIPLDFETTTPIIISKPLFAFPFTFPIRFLSFRKINFPHFFDNNWTYLLNYTINNKKVSSKVRLIFTDKALYNTLAKTINPTEQHYNFLKAYTGIIEMYVSNAAFNIDFDFRKTAGAANATLKIQVINQMVKSEETDEIIDIQKNIAITSGNATTAQIEGENIQKIRLKKTEGSVLKAITIQTYNDFHISRQAADWQAIESGFALSLDEPTVFNRLQKTDQLIDNAWPQFNQGAKVNIQNYRDKWNKATDAEENDPPMSEAVSKFIALSNTSRQALEHIDAANNASTDENLPALNYASILNLLALDYHIARMIGLGYIDEPNNASINDKFVYKISYQNRTSVDNAQQITRQYLSLPTAKTDSRLPAKPNISPISYGFPVDNQLSQSLFDGNGYSSLSDVRIVKVGRQAFAFEQAADAFFETMAVADNFNTYQQSIPVMYGIEYRETNQPNYVKPEITGSKRTGKKYFAKPEGTFLETVPVLDNATSLYIHFESEAGIHHYAIYGINLFSRTSALSDEVSTDTTVFKPRNTLQAPTNIGVQYIQKENTLLFTTKKEQEWLTRRKETFPNVNVCFTRVTFNWLDIVDVSHLQKQGDLPLDLSKIATGNKIDFWFKAQQPAQISGIISNISPVPNQANKAMIHVAGYKLISGKDVDPNSPPLPNYNHFIGSLLNTEEAQFAITDITRSNNKLNITVEKAFQSQNIKNEAQTDVDNFGTREYSTSPKVGSRFTIIENLGNPSNYNAVPATVNLVCNSLSTTPIELPPPPPPPQLGLNEPATTTKTTLLIGGITSNAIITQKLDRLNKIITGCYTVAFPPDIALAPHPQTNIPFNPANPTANNPNTLQPAHVEWYKGLIRVPVTNPDNSKTEIKLMNVLLIEQLNPLKLTVYSPTTYMVGPNPVNEIITSATTDVIPVNFHPGYRAYLFPATVTPPIGDLSFNTTNIEPDDNQTDRKTLLALQASDVVDGISLSSVISAPVVQLARNIVEPVELDPPIPLNLKVRPNAIGKATFTFDIKLLYKNGAPRKPFGFMFYRLSSADVLEALYKPDTIDNILKSLKELTLDANFNQRYFELINLKFDEQDPTKFKVYDALPSPYGFPKPDAMGLVNDVDTQATKVEKYKAAIRKNLLPLTEQPPIYAFIKEGTQTDNKTPTIKNKDGYLLNASDTNFDPFPMVKILPATPNTNATFIRVSDYSLKAASRFYYFYAAAETTNQLDIGPLSLFTGPVTILHTTHDEAPIINSFNINQQIGLGESPLTVTFQLSPLLADNRNTKIRLYRTIDIEKTTSLNTMDAFVDVPIVSTSNFEGIEIIDTLEDISPLPLGETLYYRLASIRIIVNEKNVLEEVVSQGSAVIAINLIDTYNPDAPQITYSASDNKLTWPTNVNKGKYFLYKQNDRGNWEKLPNTLPNQYQISPPLVLTDEDGDRIYHRFKVKVENSSGLLNLTENEITI